MCAPIEARRNVSSAARAEIQLLADLACIFGADALIEIQLEGFFDDGKPLLGPQNEAECDAWLLEVLRVIGRGTIQQILKAIDYELTADEVRRSLKRLQSANRVGVRHGEQPECDDEAARKQGNAGRDRRVRFQ